MIMHGIAWLLNDLFFDDDVWAGFLVEAAFFLLLAAIRGLFAYRSFKDGPADAGHGDRGGEGDQGELRERERGDELMNGTPTTQLGGSSNGRYVPPAPGSRSAEQIRADVVRQRHELARSMDALRVRWSEATDVKAQVEKHQSQILVGVAVVGALTAALLLRRRRRR